MPRIIHIVTLVIATALPQVARSQGLAAGGGDGGPLQTLLESILIFINSALIPFIIGIGFLFFVWGMFLYFIAGGADDEKKEKGKSLVIHAIIGFVVIIIFFGVINMIVESIGLQGESLEDIPTVFVP